MNEFALNATELNGSVYVYADSCSFDVSIGASGDNKIALLFPDSQASLSLTSNGLVSAGMALVGVAQCELASTSIGYCRNFVVADSIVSLSSSLDMVKKSYIIGDTASAISLSPVIDAYSIQSSFVAGESSVAIDYSGQARIEIKGNDFSSDVAIDTLGEGRVTGKIIVDPLPAVIQVSSDPIGHVAYAANFDSALLQVGVSSSAYANLTMAAALEPGLMSLSLGGGGLLASRVEGIAQCNIDSTSSGYSRKLLAATPTISLSQSLELVKKSYIIGSVPTYLSIDSVIDEAVVAANFLAGDGAIELEHPGQVAVRVGINPADTVIRFLAPAFGHVGNTSMIGAPTVQLRFSPKLYANLRMQLSAEPAYQAVSSYLDSSIGGKLKLSSNAYVRINSSIETTGYKYSYLGELSAAIEFSAVDGVGKPVINNNYFAAAPLRAVRVGMEVG